MASRYSIYAEMPPTRNSLRRSQSNQDRNTLLTSNLKAIGEIEMATPQNALEKLEGRQHQNHLEQEKQQPISQQTDTRGYLILNANERFAVTSKPFLQDDSNDLGRTRTSRLAYLEGIRGIAGFQTLLWMFFRIFAPAIVEDRDVDGVYPAVFTQTSPQWMNILRKTLSPLLLDGSLLVTTFIILFGRVQLQTFIETRNPIGLSGVAFRRPFRLAIPIAITLALVTVMTKFGAFHYAPELSQKLNNQLAQPPQMWTSVVEFWNSLLFYFFADVSYKTSRAVMFLPPSGIMWFLAVIFQQTYAIIVLAWCLPFTVLKYKNLGLASLILVTAWVGHWSWYTMTGLALAEYSVVYLQLIPTEGIPVNARGTRFIPTWLPGMTLLVIGAFLKYLWIAIVPQNRFKDEVAHVDGTTGQLNVTFDPSKVALPRWDDWLVVTGFLMLIELSPSVQRFLSARPFQYLARLSFSICLFSGSVMLVLGSLVYHHLTVSLNWTNPAAITSILFLTTIPTSLLIADVYSRTIDDGSLWLSKAAFKWIRN